MSADPPTAPSSPLPHPAPPIRVLIADDHPVVRDGLAGLIEDEDDLTLVASAADGRQALDPWREHRPDVALLDLRMPGLEGVEVLEAIRREAPTARVILLTTFETDEDIQRGLLAGARAYLLKDASRQTLLDTIRAVHAGRRRFAPEVAEKMAEHVHQPSLTEREMAVLRQIFAGKGNGEIALALDLAEATVKVHARAVLKKLGAADRTQAVLVALRRGLVRLGGR